MSNKWRKRFAVILSICMMICGVNYVPGEVKGADSLMNVANGRNGYTFMTSNANTLTEGFLYVGNGFSAINCCNENLANGNNLLGQTATTEEVAVYVDLGKDYDISNAKIYQGSTNANYYDSYCRSYKIYYSTDQVAKTNAGDLIWNLAGQCENGTIYDASTTKIKNAEHKSTTGDEILFGTTVTARSIKIVFDKEACMGTGTGGNNTGTIGTVSLLSIQIYGVEHTEETKPEETSVVETTSGSEEITTENTETDDTLYASFYDDLALKSNHSAVIGYASSNLRSGATSPLVVNNLTNGNTTGTNYIIANTPKDTAPWFAVDLGSVQDINKVTVTPGADSSTYPNAYPISYKIQVAKETTAASSASAVANLTWSTVAEVNDGTLAAKSVTFPRKNARFVRILVDSYKDYCSLYELSVYQTDDSRLLGEEDDMMNVLFVGNSMTYYNTLCKVVEGLAKSQGKQIQCTASTQGGTNLIYHTTFTNTISAIQSGAYDVVILQDIVGSFDGDKLMEGATILSNMAKEYNPDVRILLYMPWPVKGAISGEDSLLPYFTYNYIKTARTLSAALAPAGEAWYELYHKYTDMEWYCADEKHPHAIGTFVSACSVYYALFPDMEKITINSTNQTAINKIINDNIAYSGDPVTQYEAVLLDDISNNAYHYTHAVIPSVEDKSGQTKYTSVAGEYFDADDEIDKEGLTEVTGEEVDKSLFTKENGNIAVGCNAVASNERQKASNATDGNTGTRWETDYEDPQWLYVDLGTVKSIDKVGFVWEGAYAKKYYIQISDNAEDWTTVAMVTASSEKTVQITLDKAYSTRYVRMYGTRRGTGYGYSFWEMGIWETGKPSYQITVDGEEAARLAEGEAYTLPTDAKYGYYMDGKMYPAGATVEITSDMSFTSVNDLSVTVEQGAGIRLEGTAGIRFRATVYTDNEEALTSDAITEGMLITANDLYENLGKETLNLDSDYTFINITNSGWYNDHVGTYCGSIVNIAKSNYIRNFIARAYVTIHYENAEAVTVYSEMTGARSIQYVAEAIQKAGYEGIAEEYRNLIDQYAAAK